MRFSRTHLAVRRCYLPTSKRASPQSGKRFEQLATCDPDDVVVIAFSGHGTETHELVGHDTDPYDLARTTIPLTMLGEWCSRIPSRRLLIVLDCCFSGGMGAKALQVEAVPRDIQSVEGKLNQISGEGRVVLTASGPTQKKSLGEPQAWAWLFEPSSANLRSKRNSFATRTPCTSMHSSTERGRHC